MTIGEHYETVFSATVSYYGFPVTVNTPAIAGTSFLPSFISYNPANTILSYFPTLVA